MKKFFTAVILPATLAMLFISCQQSSATAKDVNAQPRNTVEQKRVNHITYGVDYENPITGEYLRWGPIEFTRSGHYRRSFSFDLRYSFYISDIPVNDSTVNFSTEAIVYHASNYGVQVPGHDSHPYTIEMRGQESYFYTNGSYQSGSFSGFTPGNTYSMRIANAADFDTGLYILGSVSSDSFSY